MVNTDKPATKDNTPREPRLTVRMLHTEQVNLADAHREHKDEVSAKFAQYDYKLQEVRRKAGGSESAHRRIAELETDLQQIHILLEAVGDAPISETGLRIKEAELKAIEDLIDQKITDLPEEIGRLNVRIGVVEGKVNSVDSKVDRNHTEVNGKLQRVTHRVFTLESLVDKVPWWQVVIGLGVATFIYLFGLLPYTFVDSLTLPDGEVITQPNPHYNLWWWKLLIAIGIFALVTGLLILIGQIASSIGRKVKASRNEDEANNEAPAIPLAPRTVVNTSSASAGDTAPTRVYEPQGAASGTR